MNQSILSQIEKLPPYITALPAKSGEKDGDWLPYWVHAVDTAEIVVHLLKYRLSSTFFRVFLPEIPKELLIRLCRFLAMVHDVGKLTAGFAARISPAVDGLNEMFASFGLTVPRLSDLQTTPHALAGQALLELDGCPVSVAAVVGAHHGKPIGLEMHMEIKELPQNAPFGFFGTDKSNRALWKDAQKQWMRLSREASGFSGYDDLPKLSLKQQMLLVGLLIMADWIASNEKYFPRIQTGDIGSTALYPTRIDDAIRTLQMTDLWEPMSYYMDSDAFESLFGFLPNDVQKCVVHAVEQTVDPGIFILEAQMGVGKTEAALAAADLLAAKKGCSGIFFGLPTRATADGLLPRLLAFAALQNDDGHLSVRLAHQFANLNERYRALPHVDGSADVESDDDGAKLIVHSWFEGGKQALLADIVIGTVDQLLMAALKQKHVMLRHLGLVGKVVIVDECHAYDAYMNVYLDRALEWLGSYGIPVILLSATLPPKRRAALIQAYQRSSEPTVPDTREYPLLTYTDGDRIFTAAPPVRHSEKTVRVQTGDDEEITTILSDALREGGCAGVIVNTVRRAQTIADTIRAALPDKQVILLHAQFTAEDRTSLEQSVVAAVGKNSTAKIRDGVIVVGTQVLEQSLDIDFDVLITDLCPMDLLLQRMGRLHRHARERPNALSESRCFVLGVNADDYESGAKAIYGEWLLEQTKRYLPEAVIIPDDIPILVGKTYEEGDEESKAFFDYQNKQKTMREKAKEFCLKSPQMKRNGIIGLLDTKAEDRWAERKVRDGDPSIDVLLMCRYKDGSVHFLPWCENGKRLSADHVPSEEEARRILMQRVSLPHFFYYRIDDVIKELEDQNTRYLHEWQSSPWLEGELILLLDEDNRCSLCGYNLIYDNKNGILFYKE